jgi:hypothetical protein
MYVHIQLFSLSGIFLWEQFLVNSQEEEEEQQQQQRK